MGACHGCSNEQKRRDLERLMREAIAPVILNVYDLGQCSMIQGLDVVVQDFLHIGGIFHSGVEIYGQEWSYGCTQSPRTGVSCDFPRRNPLHRFKEAIFMGDCGQSREDVQALIMRMQQEWLGPDYDLLRKNCCSFANSLCKRLGVGPIPDWVDRLAHLGGSISDDVRQGLMMLHLVDKHIEGTWPRSGSPGSRRVTRRSLPCC
mmetsp:Transcript_124449/g.265233  ORF Transcript_124449/g.265233 Transcript_124449/m.265233 type:complete len:204 (+) Transcript_124449:1-612(+)